MTRHTNERGLPATIATESGKDRFETDLRCALTSSTTSTSRCAAPPTPTTSSEPRHGRSTLIVDKALWVMVVCSVVLSVVVSEQGMMIGSPGSASDSFLLYTKPRSTNFSASRLVVGVFLRASSFERRASSFELRPLTLSAQRPAPSAQALTRCAMNSMTISKTALRPSSSSKKTHLSNPLLDGFHMPAEWEAHERYGWLCFLPSIAMTTRSCWRSRLLYCCLCLSEYASTTTLLHRK